MFSYLLVPLLIPSRKIFIINHLLGRGIAIFPCYSFGLLKNMRRCGLTVNEGVKTLGDQFPNPSKDKLKMISSICLTLVGRVTLYLHQREVMVT